MTEENSFLTKEPETEPSGVTLKAVDILQQKFALKFRGYDVQDVDSFLEVVAREVERISNENIKIKDDVLVLKNEVQIYKKKEESINAALVTVQKMAEDVRNSAAKEAEKIIADANLEAQKIEQAARDKDNEANTEMHALRSRAESEARKITDDARLEAGRIMEKVEDDKRDCEQEMQRRKIDLQTEINTLTQRKIQFQSAMKSIIDTHQKLLESETD
jgi:cell division initiation protein